MSNEITAFFRGRIGVCESVYQYDYGMVIVLDDIELESPFDAYFETSGADEAIPVIGESNRVAIPNSCLNRSGTVTLHIPLHTGQNDSETEYKVSFKVIGRAKPVDDEDAGMLQTAVSKAIALIQNPNRNLLMKIKSIQDQKVNKPINKYGQVNNGSLGQQLITNGDGTTQWMDREMPTDEQTLDAVSNWLNNHPEATTTVLDDSITFTKLGSDLKEFGDLYYDLPVTKYRYEHTDCYVVEVPMYDNNGDLIDLYLEKDSSVTPTEYARKHHTTLTVNGNSALQVKDTSTFVVGNAFSRGNLINHNDLSGEFETNSSLYISINRDRTVDEYPITTTAEELSAFGVYTLFTVYYKLIENGAALDLSNVTVNEGGSITDNNPLMAVAIKPDGTLMFVACDGRTIINSGLTAAQMQAFCLDHGAQSAWMLDGGGSTSMTYRESKVNRNIDDNGTSDRAISYKLNVKKEKTVFDQYLAEAFSKIGEEKQAIIKQIVPVLNDLSGKTGFTTSVGTMALGQNSTLDSIVSPGRYWVDTNAIAETIPDSPASSSFSMVVEYMRPNVLLYTLKDYDGNVFTRRNHIYSDANHFTPWQKVEFESRYTLLKGKYDLTEVVLPPGAEGYVYEIPVPGLTNEFTVTCTCHYAEAFIAIRQITDDKLIVDVKNLSDDTPINGFLIHYIAVK